MFTLEKLPRNSVRANVARAVLRCRRWTGPLNRLRLQLRLPAPMSQKWRSAAQAGSTDRTGAASGSDGAQTDNDLINSSALAPLLAELPVAVAAANDVDVP
jgi:hypothetical protein